MLHATAIGVYGGFVVAVFIGNALFKVFPFHATTQYLFCMSIIVEVLCEGWRATFEGWDTTLFVAGWTRRIVHLMGLYYIITKHVHPKLRLYMRLTTLTAYALLVIRPCVHLWALSAISTVLIMEPLCIISLAGGTFFTFFMSGPHPLVKLWYGIAQAFSLVVMVVHFGVWFVTLPRVHCNDTGDYLFEIVTVALQTMCIYALYVTRYIAQHEPLLSDRSA